MCDFTTPNRGAAALAAGAMAGCFLAGCGFMGGQSAVPPERDQSAQDSSDADAESLDAEGAADSVDAQSQLDGGGDVRTDAGPVAEPDANAISASDAPEPDGWAAPEVVDITTTPPDPCAGLPEYATQTGCVLPVLGASPPPMNGQNPASAGPPARDGECKPLICRECQSACDCKFVIAGCYLVVASKASPWNHWYPASGPGTPCYVAMCGTIQGPPFGSTLACEAGQCVIKIPKAEP